MRRLILGGVAALATASAGSWTTAAAAPPGAPQAYRCVWLGPVVILGIPVVPDTYEVCVPSPIGE